MIIKNTLAERDLGRAKYRILFSYVEAALDVLYNKLSTILKWCLVQSCLNIFAVHTLNCIDNLYIYYISDAIESKAMKFGRQLSGKHTLSFKLQIMHFNLCKVCKLSITLHSDI